MDGQTGDLVRISPFIPFILVRGETATLVCCHCIARNISCLLNRKHRAPRTALFMLGHSKAFLPSAHDIFPVLGTKS